MRAGGAQLILRWRVFSGPSDLFDCSDAPVKHQFSSEERWDVGGHCFEEDDSYLTEVSPSTPLRHSRPFQLLLLSCAI